MSSAPPAASGVPTVVIATRDRRPRLLETLARLAALPERPPVIVVDNASRDGTADAVEQAFPQVTVLRLARDLAPAARTRGIAAAATPLVALTDDDSWWAAGALRRAAPVFDAHPRLGLLAARILVEPGGRLDATWPLPAGSSPTSTTSSRTTHRHRARARGSARASTATGSGRSGCAARSRAPRG